MRGTQRGQPAAFLSLSFRMQGSFVWNADEVSAEMSSPSPQSLLGLSLLP